MKENGQSEVISRLEESFRGCKVPEDCSRAGDSINELRRQVGLAELRIPRPCVNLMLDACLYGKSNKQTEQITSVSYPKRGEQP